MARVRKFMSGFTISQYGVTLRPRSPRVAHPAMQGRLVVKRDGIANQLIVWPWLTRAVLAYAVMQLLDGGVRAGFLPATREEVFEMLKRLKIANRSFVNLAQRSPAYCRCRNCNERQVRKLGSRCGE